MQFMIWTGVALAIALIAVWLVPASRGAPRRSDQLEAALDQLLNCELQQAFLSIRPKFATNKFLQFDRYPMSDDRMGIELAFPNAPWSDDYFPKVVTAASGNASGFPRTDDTKNHEQEHTCAWSKT